MASSRFVTDSYLLVAPILPAWALAPNHAPEAGSCGPMLTVGRLGSVVAPNAGAGVTISRASPMLSSEETSRGASLLGMVAQAVPGRRSRLLLRSARPGRPPQSSKRCTGTENAPPERWPQNLPAHSPEGNHS